MIIKILEALLQGVRLSYLFHTQKFNQNVYQIQSSLFRSSTEYQFAVYNPYITN